MAKPSTKQIQRVTEAVIKENKPGSPDLPILVIGGDHPYQQWDNNKKGLGAAYLDAGITPYLAVCWDASTERTSGNGATFRELSGASQMMTLAAGLDLQKRGIEFVSHATRHVHFWDQINTGIRISYSGAAGSPTVQITSTGIVLVGNGGAENATLTWAAYPTLAQIKAAIDSQAGTVWKCYLAAELDGTERSSYLIPIKTPRNVSAPGASDTTESNQRFALSAGIVLDYKGTAYQNCTAHLGADNIFRIYGDGVRLISIDLTVTDTLSAVVTAINGYAISGLTARLTDNGYSSQSPKFRETYVWGDELSTSLRQTQWVVPGLRSAYIQANGFDITYVIRKLLRRCRDDAAAAGINLLNFAQPGGQFQPHLRRASLDIHRAFRTEFSEISLDSPKAMPAFLLKDSTTQVTFSTSYDSADTIAALRALADSGPWYVDVLIHGLIPDGSSGYDMATTVPSEADQTEANFMALRDEIKRLMSAGAIRQMTPEGARLARQSAAKPKNMVFNPRFINSGKPFLGVDTAALGSNGRLVPGWRTVFSTANFTAAGVVNGRLSMTTNGALSSTIYPVQQKIFLEKGRTYDIGMILDLSDIPTNKSVRLSLFANFGNVSGDLRPGFQAVVQSASYFGGSIHDAFMTFTVPARGTGQPARIISKAGPFNLTAGAAVSVNYDAIGAVSAVIAGATPSATKPEEVADAINAAIKADAAYSSRQEWWTAAKVIGGKIYIVAPYMNQTPTAQYISVANGTGNPMATVWGGTEARAVSQLHEPIDTSFLNFTLAIEMASGLSGSVVAEAPYAMEVKYDH
jgi:hypothetical protein